MKTTVSSIKRHLLAGLLLGAGGGLSNAAVLYTYADVTPELVNNDNAFVLPGMPIDLFRDATATGTLYFQYTVTNPASNRDTEAYYAGMSFYYLGGENLGIGNGWDPYAYSAFSGGVPGGNIDLKSATPEPGEIYQHVRSSDTTTIVFRIDFNSGIGANDNVTVWLNPNLSLTEAAQNPLKVTTFTANANFDTVMLREGDDGVGIDNPAGWTFSNVIIAENSSDTGFFAAVPEPSSAMFCALGGIALLRRRRRNP